MATGREGTRGSRYEAGAKRHGAAAARPPRLGGHLERPGTHLRVYINKPICQSPLNTSPRNPLHHSRWVIKVNISVFSYVTAGG